MYSRNAYAKINLSLDIVGRRADGYHLLRTIMQPVSLCDRVFAEKREKISLSCDMPDVPVNGENTAIRAAREFFSYTGLSGGVRLHIEKRIPMQSGLGGGSADAAAVLHLLNQLYETGLPTETLCALGERVGADVPFCVFGKTALAEGIGEILHEAPPIPPCSVVIVRPAAGVSTAAAYAEIDRRRRNAEFPETTDRMLNALRSGCLAEVGQAVFNAFDAVSRDVEIESVKARLSELGAVGAGMSGSGSAVFGLFVEGDPRAEGCVRLFREAGRFAFLCRPVSA